jgi:hypothetical protein
MLKLITLARPLDDNIAYTQKGLISTGTDVQSPRTYDLYDLPMWHVGVTLFVWGTAPNVSVTVKAVERQTIRYILHTYAVGSQSHVR